MVDHHYRFDSPPWVRGMPTQKMLDLSHTDRLAEANGLKGLVLTRVDAVSSRAVIGVALH